jgi:hypothetical protein
LKLIFEVSDAPLPNCISAGVPATMVDLVRSGRTPEELAREFEPTAQSISTWVKQADRDAGKRIDGRQALSGMNWGAFDVRTIACVSQQLIMRTHWLAFQILGRAANFENGQLI